MNVYDFVNRYIYNTVNHNLFRTALGDEQILGTIDQALTLVFSYPTGGVYSWQERVIEAKNPGGNVLEFHLKTPMVGSRVKFYYGPESTIETRFKETSCVCSDPDPIDDPCCECRNVGCPKGSKIDLGLISPGTPLQNNSYQIYGGYAGGGDFGDRVRLKFCAPGCNTCTQEKHSIYMVYYFMPRMMKSLSDKIPLPPAYLLPLSFYFKGLIIPGMENRLANQEVNYWNQAELIMKKLTNADVGNNPKTFNI